MKISRHNGIGPRRVLLAALAAACGTALTAADVNVLDHGVVGDGETNNTAAIAEALAACAGSGGGKVVFPAGRYLTGSVHLEDDITLYLAEGAELLYSGDPADSPLVRTRWEGTMAYTHGPLVYANGKKNVGIAGRGTINGQGENWWWRNLDDKSLYDRTMPPFRAWKAVMERIQNGEEVGIDEFEEPAKFLRPSLVVFFECENVRVEGVTLYNSPMWMLHPIFCENVLVTGVSFVSHGANGDGIDIDSSRNVRVSDCYFDTEDDCIVIKSGRDADGRRIGRASEFITITNCVMYRGHGAVVIGSEMSGGVRDVSASNIVCYGTDRGIRLKTGRGRGGVMENMRFDNWVIHEAGSEAIQISTSYVDLPPEEFSERTPTIRNISISNITIVDARQAINIAGLEEQPVEGIRLSDIRADGQVGMTCELANDIELHDVRLDVDYGPAFRFSNAENLLLDNVTCQSSIREPVLALNNAREVWLRDSRSFGGNRTYLQVQGGASRGILLEGNKLSASSTPFITGPDVPEEAVVIKN